MGPSRACEEGRVLAVGPVVRLPCRRDRATLVRQIHGADDPVQVIDGSELDDDLALGLAEVDSDSGLE